MSVNNMYTAIAVDNMDTAVAVDTMDNVKQWIICVLL